MEKKEIIKELKRLSKDKDLNFEQRLAVLESIIIVKKAKKRADWIKAGKIIGEILLAASKYLGP